MRFNLRFLSDLITGRRLGEYATPALRKYSEDELGAFELAMGVVLPEGYRDYLKNVGAGQAAGSRVDPLEEWAQPSDAEEMPENFMRSTFPHGDGWNDTSLLDSDKGWKAPYYDSSLIAGAIRIANTGCEGYDLLVVTGQARGQVWHDDRACGGKGIFPLLSRQRRRLSFTDWIDSEVADIIW